MVKVPCKTLIVLGSGGHTREMLGIVKSMSPALYSPRIYVTAGSDEFSSNKVQALESDRLTEDYKIINICRTREVGQSWFTTIFTALISLLHSVKLVLHFRPTLILCNGPGLCVPICLAAYIFKTVKLVDVKMIYVESICRVKSLSLSGKILKFVVDKFLVQWDDVQVTQNGKFQNIGRVS